ncbi:ABC transporter permease [Aquihabitans sp. McL0605]|uniref:ABC transporter permease n=1 Tax=Aquihabitans sp. McL0605 TaxID=3415671 RepID=UPI003CFAF851
MHQFLSLTVGGLATAAIYAVAASGLVLTYTTTGTFNFAHGAIGMVAAFLYWQLHYDWGWSTPVALVVVLLVAGPLAGAAWERAIMRRLEGTSETTRLVVTIALLLGLLGAAVYVWSPSVGRPMRQFFQGHVLDIGGVLIPWYQLVSLATAALVAVGLRLLLYRARAGVAMRAAVDNRPLAALNGARPERSAMLAWALGFSLAALSGILIAPTLTLSAVPLTLLIINAYGAAVFGRLRSLPLTFLGAIILGLVHDYAVGYLPDLSATAQPYVRGLVDAIPAILLFIVLLVLPAGRLKSVVRTREIAVKPSWGGSLGLAAAVIAVTAMVAPLLSDSGLVSAGKVWGLALVGLSMVPLIGLCGQLSLSQLTFAGMGALAYTHLGWHNPLGLVWAALIAGLVGVLVALPAIRLEGIYIALTTAAFTVICDRWLFSLPEFSVGHHSVFLFPNGTLPVVRPHFLGIDLTGPTAYFVYSSVVFAVLLVVVVAVRRSTFGDRLIAVKEGPAAVASCGINVKATKIAVFAFSGAIAGVGGAIIAGSEPASSTTFGLVAGLSILMTMVIGGISSVGAPIFVGVFLGSSVMASIFPQFARWQYMLLGFAGVGLGKNPNGLSADLRPASARVKRDVPVLVGLLVVLVAIWGLRIADTYSNGPYLALTLVALIAAPVIAARRAGASVSLADDEAGAGTVHSLVVEAEGHHDAREDGLHAPPELLGLTEPFRPTDVAALDDALDLVAANRRIQAGARA